MEQEARCAAVRDYHLRVAHRSNEAANSSVFVSSSPSDGDVVVCTTSPDPPAEKVSCLVPPRRNIDVATGVAHLHGRRRGRN
eukprot:13081770-Alexandrium_andersonii.AAC.1